MSVTMTGPMFDGRAVAASEAMTHAVEAAVAEFAVSRVRSTLDGVLRHPTGYYKSRVQAQRRQDGYDVTDGGVVYGPWLEGVGSRNQTTRFKGYFTFRQAGQQVERSAGPVINAVTPRFVEMMN